MKKPLQLNIRPDEQTIADIATVRDELWRRERVRRTPNYGSKGIRGTDRTTITYAISWALRRAARAIEANNSRRERGATR